MQTIHLICNAHLDPVWKWDWEEGLAEALSTFETAADLLENHPDYIFNHNESVLYEWTLEHRPELFARIQRLVKAGRWHIAGGWYLQPDCNFPDGESFIRQIVVGREFFRKHFGVAPAVAYNFDAFGHHGNLPQILKKAGYRAYIHFRPSPPELELPGDLYRWRGIDKSEVLAYRPPFTWYGSDDFHELNRRIEQTTAEQAKAPGPVGIFWGMGDHGGGATRADLAEIARQRQCNPALQHSTTDRLLEDLEAVDVAQLPLHVGDLQRSFTGCYTSAAPVKQANRRAESLAQQAERFATLAWWFAGAPYPREKMLSIWKDTLFNQFHDILPGSSTRQALLGAAEIAGRQHANAREVILQAQLELARSPQPRPPLSLLVFNPLPYTMKVPVDFEYMVGHRPVFDRAVVTRITNAAGETLPSQEEMARSVTTRFDWRKRAVFEAELPPLGYGLFQIHLDTKGAKAPKPGVTFRKVGKRWVFSNPYVSLTLNPATGWVEALSTGKTGGNLLREPGGRLLVLRDEGDSWGSDILRYENTVGTFRLATPEEMPAVSGQLQLEAAAPVRIIEAGPVRTIVEVVQIYNRSTAVLRYTVYAHHPEVELEVRLVWNEPRHMAKLSWPTCYDTETYRVEVPYGDVERLQNSGEQPAGRWALLSAKGRADALGIFAQGPGGHDVCHGDFRLSLVRSAIYCHHNLHPLRTGVVHDFMDLGETRFHLALLASPARTIRQKLTRLTERLSLPPTAAAHFPHGASSLEGAAAGEGLISLDGVGVELGAIKPAEDGDDLVVRLVERHGRAATALLSLRGTLEQYPLTFGPYEIVTLRISRAGEVRECNLLERPSTL